MKKIIISILVVVSVVILSTGCHESIGDTYDFSETYPNYVQFSDTTLKTQKADSLVQFSVISRTAFSEADVNVVYNVSGKNYNQDVTVKLQKLTKSQIAKFIIPHIAVADDVYRVKIVAASDANGKEVRVGQVSGRLTAFSILVE